MTLSHLIMSLRILNAQVNQNYCSSTGRSIFLLEVSSAKSLVQYCFHNNNLPQHSHNWNMHFWLYASQTASFKRSVRDGSFSIAITKRCIFSWYVHRHMSAGVLALSMTWSAIQLQKVDWLIFAFGCSQNISKASLKVYIM